MPLKCVFCEKAHLPSERCGSDTEGGLLGGRRAGVLPVEDERAREALAGVREEMAKPRLDRARAALSKVEERKEVRPLSSTNIEPLSKAPAASAKRPGPQGFDRNAYHKAYMREYMRGWRARRKVDGSAETSDYSLRGA